MKTVLRCLEDVLYRRARSYLPFNFANAKIRVAIRLAEDGKIMGNLLFELYPRMISIEIFTIFGPFCKSWIGTSALELELEMELELELILQMPLFPVP